MKIYILPGLKKLRPSAQLFQYPKHNDDYGVEQDFLIFLERNKDLITYDPLTADWHYLPVFWTRWHLNHNYAREGLEELQRECDHLIVDDLKTFTICQYDDGPLIDLGATTLFLASRKTEIGIDIPLLSSSHKYWFRRRKKYLASFLGRLSTSGYRQIMADVLKDRKDVLINDGDKGSKYFVRTTLSSYISLSPRGYGGSSFRLFEAMQLGVVPFLIGDIDTRPFQKWIDWNAFSFYTNDCEKIENIIDNVSQEKLREMGKAAVNCFQEKLSYQKWCIYVLDELKEIKNG